MNVRNRLVMALVLMTIMGVVMAPAAEARDLGDTVECGRVWVRTAFGFGASLNGDCRATFACPWGTNFECLP